MKRQILFYLGVTLGLFFIVIHVLAQPPDSIWSRTFGGSDYEHGTSVQQTTDGGYVIAGWTYSFGAGSWDFYLVKADIQGDAVWTRTYGGSSTDMAHSVQQTTDGGYIVAGATQSFGLGTPDYTNFYLVKTDSAGDTLWTRSYGGSQWDDAWSVQQTADGGYIVAGETWSFGAGDQDFYLVKTDSVGDTLWTHTYGGSTTDIAYSVQQTSDRGFIMAGFTDSFGELSGDFYVVKVDSVGDTLWTRTYGGNSEDGAYSVQQTSDGGYIVAGYTGSFGTGEDFYLIKANSQGDTLWTRFYGGTSNEEAYSVQLTTDGGYIVAGMTRSFGAGDRDFYLVKVSTQGDALWARTFGGSQREDAWSVQQTADGGYIVAGETNSFGAGLSDLWLVKASGKTPFITSITDVGNDQGRQARIRWHRCVYDGGIPGYTITSYSIYRRIDQYLFGGGKKVERETLDWPPGEWEYITTVPARGETQYATIVPTLADSTSEGIYWSVLFVSAETSNPMIYFDSEVDSGYSIDNLPPDETFLMAMAQSSPQSIRLQWQEVATGGNGQPEQSGIWYHVYGSTDPMFTPTPENLLIVTQNLEFYHNIGTNDKYFYIIKASDDH